MFRDGKWSDWQSLGGTITTTPTVIWRQGRIWAFVRGTSGRAFYKIQNPDLSWDTAASGWDLLGGPVIGRITADSAGDYVAIAAASPKGEPLLKYHDGTVWQPGNTDWMTVGMHSTSSPPVVRIVDGKAHLVIRTNYLNNDYLAILYHAIVDLKTGNLEQDWQELGREVLGDPCLIDGFDGRLHLFVRGTSRRIFRKIRENGTWTAEWENLGGEAIDSPTALAIPGQINSDPEIHLFCTGTTRRAFRKRWTGSKWVEGQLGWENLGAELDCSY
ncbi:MAG: hypothetical protein GKR99_12740 [Rhodobacteraceae bacterium]|nr:hypothetical protein [Paracoccaceae bacterium]